MLFFALFLIEFILLFILSRKLVNSLARLLYRFTKNHRVVVHTLAIIFLPGTILHELAHLLFAGVLFVPLGEMSVLPEIEGESVKLGSVQMAHTDPIRRTIIGVAPVLLGMILIFTIFLFVKIGVSPLWQVILALYFIFEIGNTMFSSRKNIEGSILLLILILVISAAILAILYFVSPNILQNFWIYLNNLNLEFAVNFFKQAAVYLLIPVALDLLIILLTKFASIGSK